MSEKLVLGYDFGTSAVKAAVFDEQGRLIAHASAAYPLLMPEPGWAEQRPDDWWRAMILATQQVLANAEVNVAFIGAIGLCAQMCGTVAVDSQGNALRNALIWLDTRSAPIARRITAGLIKISGYGVSRLFRWLWLTNGAPNLAGKDAISKILWIRENSPDVWQKTHKLLDVKDYLLARMSGQFVTTQDCAHVSWLMDARPGKLHWSSKLLQNVDLRAELLPTIASGTQVVGCLSDSAAAALGLPAQLPIVGGAGDVAAYAIGSGQLGDGAVHIHCGTGGWIAAHLDHRAVDIFSSVATICAAEAGRYLLVAAQETAGASVEWAAKCLGVCRHGEPDYAGFDALAQQSCPGARGVFFFPWMFGERVPVDNDKIRGGFLNMSLEHERTDLARAVLEGVALNTRWALRPVEKITKARGSVRLMGGGAVSDLWCQIFADVLQRPIERVFLPAFGGCRGAAMAAAVGVGWYRDLEDATAMVQVQQTFYPDEALAALYNKKFDAFVKHYQCIHPWYKRISEL
ncbi:MAG TPA: xylulose kinase [Gammaproteobacteria bacterium]|nr:xylulose kinase [Gammaproteobacteria bacterium]